MQTKYIIMYDDGSKVVFTYTGELITKAIYTEIDG
jgi:hypothetical protein